MTTPERHILVPIKEGLNGRPLKEKRILTHLIRVVALEIVVCASLLFIEVVGILLGFERRINFLIKQGLPIVVTKPDVLLYLSGSI